MMESNCKQPLRVALTGTIGAGKSTVAALFADLGIPIYNSDKEARRLMDGPLRQQVTDLLGPETYTPQGPLNRPLVASKVFANPALLTALNALVHPAVTTDFDKWAAKQKTPYVIVETALLLESDLLSHVNTVILVTAPLDIRIARAAQRDKAPPQEIARRLAAQTSQEQLTKYAEYTISTSPDVPLLEQISRIHQFFLYK